MEIKNPKALDLTSGNITKSILQLAWPAVTSMFLETFFSIANAFWVGKLGASSLAAAISSTFIIWIIYSLAAIISIGVVALVSRSVGAKDLAQAGYLSSQAFHLAIISSSVLTVAGIILTPQVFNLMGTDKEVTLIGTQYLRIIFLGTPFFFLSDTLSGVFRASGDTKTPMKVLLFATGLNIVLDPFLIFGIGPFPKMGTIGASTATVICQFLGVILFILNINKGKLPFRLDMGLKLKIDLKTIYRIVKIGIPTSVSGIVFSVVYLFLNKITALFGTEAIAALGIGNRSESLSYLTCFGFSMAAAALVGQNLGAGKPERAERLAWRTILIVVSITAFISIMFLSFPRYISTFFISDQKVINVAINYLRILGLSQIFMGMEIVFEGTFSGAGNTFPPMVVSVPGSILRIPLAYFLAIKFNLGITGVWWAITITSVVKGIVLAFWFKLGRWKRKEV
ncbi:MAG: MATE family efflux transporter [candidate division Zixibacteria bacterium]|nr:MATE family efflux transporter [candidate division Zixibacteria bacterium]